MRRRSVAAIFAVPVAITIVTLVGLAAGLLGDGWWDATSWIGLGVPAAAGLWHYRGFGDRRGRSSAATPEGRGPVAGRPR